MTDLRDRQARRDEALALRSQQGKPYTERSYVPPPKVLDAIAERALTGGYHVTDQCPVCFTARSHGGTCLCE
jgi:hypothetical protein